MNEYEMKKAAKAEADSRNLALKKSASERLAKNAEWKRKQKLSQKQATAV